MPRNFADFRFQGVDGRGRQALLHDPRTNNGVAVVRIEDPQGGREGYTFDVEWRAGADWNTGGWRRNRGESWDSASATIRAAIRGGGGEGGKCTAEVEVDGVAEVGIRGDTGRWKDAEHNERGHDQEPLETHGLSLLAAAPRPSRGFAGPRPSRTPRR